MHSPGGTPLPQGARGARGAAGDDRGESFSQIYEALRVIARRHLRRSGGATLNTTALVHEAWLKLSGDVREFEDRSHFVAVAATAMRQIIIDHARRRRSQKRGGDQRASESGLSSVGMETDIEELLAIDGALTKLEALDERLARVVEWRFFGGLEEAEIASALDVDVRTVRRAWRKARAFIVAELNLTK